MKRPKVPAQYFDKNMQMHDPIAQAKQALSNALHHNTKFHKTYMHYQQCNTLQGPYKNARAPYVGKFFKTHMQNVHETAHLFSTHPHTHHMPHEEIHPIKKGKNSYSTPVSSIPITVPSPETLHHIDHHASVHKKHATTKSMHIKPVKKESLLWRVRKFLKNIWT